MIPKKSTSYSSSIQGAKIFREEIDYIISRCSQKGIDVVISDDENVFDSIDELITMKGLRPNKVQLSGKLNGSLFDSINIDFSTAFISIRTFGTDDLVSFGYELNSYLVKRIPSYYNLSQHPSIGFMIWFLSAFCIGGAPQLKETLIFKLIVFITILLFIFWLITYLDKKQNHKINLIRMHEHGFIKRNSDKILMMLLSALVGSILTLFVSWLISKQ